MIRIIGFLLIVLSVFGLSYSFVNQKVPVWESTVKSLMIEGQDAGFSFAKWQKIQKRAQKELPSFYPFSKIHNILGEVLVGIKRVEGFSATSHAVDFSLEKKWVDPKGLEVIFKFLAENQKSLDRILSNLYSIPRWILSPEQKAKFNAQIAWLEYLQENLEDAQKFEYIFKQFLKDKEEVLVLLQNQNEPRSTGGFSGSLVQLSFSESKIFWKFLDIYELDRKISEDKAFSAPPFFHKLSKVISLRDANFSPSFPLSAKNYRYFLEVAGEKAPRTIVAINLNIIRELMKISPEIKFPKWNIALDENNFDVGLQFLVESKIMGRFEVKEPIMLFVKELLSPDNLKKFSWTNLKKLDVKSFLQHKNILANSQSRELQKLFEKWHIDGTLRKKREADNFIHFDFVSIGANKSEKFVWTKIFHDSEISPDGVVKNRIRIKRTHALHKFEIQDLLGTNFWSQNVKDLLTENLLWKLGAGESRVMLRVWIPKFAQLTGSHDPSGEIRESTFTKSKDFKIIEVPMNVLPGETLNLDFEYETDLFRGSRSWRPYVLELSGTPGRGKTSYMSTISISHKGKFVAETQNIGRPQDLIDTEFRAVVEFPKEGR